MTDSTGRAERELARKTLQSLFDRDPTVAASVVVPLFCTLAEDGTNTSERLDAIDTLRGLYPEIKATEQERIGQTLAEIAGNATYEDERRRARQRLQDVTIENSAGSAGTGSGTDETETDDVGNAVGYLGVSLAEHLEAAAGESPEACHQRATELRDFLAANPVSDAAYDELYEEVDGVVEQLEIVPADNSLAEDRQKRVRELATRIRRLHERSG